MRAKPGDKRLVTEFAVIPFFIEGEWVWFKTIYSVQEWKWGFLLGIPRGGYAWRHLKYVRQPIDFGDNRK